jgi:DNA-binding response OmpR family regulator
MNGARVLVVADDTGSWRSMLTFLRKSGYVTLRVRDGRDGIRRVGTDHPDLVLLDIGQPVPDGWELLDRIRGVSQVPVVLLTTRGLEMDKVRGLRAGADDFLTKPFSQSELAARIGALLRRSHTPPARDALYDDGRVQVDFVERTVRTGDGDVLLTPTEFRLLSALVRNSDRVLSPHRLLEMAWGDDSGTGLGRVKFTVLSVRRKLRWDDVGQSPIENVRGFGYRYRKPD